MDAIRTFKTKRCFVDSMSDTFHSNVSDADLTRLLDSCAANDKGTNWLLLTKRAERLAEISQGYSFSKKIWMGVSVCTKATGFPRLDALRKTRAAIMWASVEPFLEAVDLSPWLADGSLNWVVVGGESGPNHRPCNPEWIRAIRDQCANHNVPFFFKQFSGARPAKHPLLDGVQYEQYPHDDFHKE
jgi:protein gp37